MYTHFLECWPQSSLLECITHLTFFGFLRRYPMYPATLAKSCEMETVDRPSLDNNPPPLSLMQMETTSCPAIAALIDKLLSIEHKQETIRNWEPFGWMTPWVTCLQPLKPMALWTRLALCSKWTTGKKERGLSLIKAFVLLNLCTAPPLDTRAHLMDSYPQSTQHQVSCRLPVLPLVTKWMENHGQTQSSALDPSFKAGETDASFTS